MDSQRRQGKARDDKGKPELTRQSKRGQSKTRDYQGKTRDDNARTWRRQNVI